MRRSATVWTTTVTVCLTTGLLRCRRRAARANAPVPVFTLAARRRHRGNPVVLYSVTVVVHTVADLHDGISRHATVHQLSAEALQRTGTGAFALAARRRHRRNPVVLNSVTVVVHTVADLRNGISRHATVHQLAAETFQRTGTGAFALAARRRHRSNPVVLNSVTVVVQTVADLRDGISRHATVYQLAANALQRTGTGAFALAARRRHRSNPVVLNSVTVVVQTVADLRDGISRHATVYQLAANALQRTGTGARWSALAAS